jgi:hypothetical protein
LKHRYKQSRTTREYVLTIDTMISHRVGRTIVIGVKLADFILRNMNPTPAPVMTVISLSQNTLVQGHERSMGLPSNSDWFLVIAQADTCGSHGTHNMLPHRKPRRW